MAFFGAKDAQQVAVVKRLTRDLGFETEIVVVPTIREPSGLAMSSRNEYLSPDERDRAAVIYRGLREARDAYEKGERKASKLAQIVEDRLATEPLARIDYVAVVNNEDLEPIENIGDNDAVIAVAARFGKVRLIDNVLLTSKQ